MHDVGLVTTLTTAITGLSISFLGFLFVDDTDIVVIGNGIASKLHHVLVIGVGIYQPPSLT